MLPVPGILQGHDKSSSSDNNTNVSSAGEWGGEGGGVS